MKCAVEIGGTVSSNKGVNLPRTYLPIPSITDEDRDNLEFAISTTSTTWRSRSCAGPRTSRTWEADRRAGRRARVIAKIEKAEAIEHLDGIVALRTA